MELKFDNIDIDDYIEFLKSKGITYETNFKEYVEALHNVLNKCFDLVDNIRWGINYIKTNDEYQGHRDAILLYMIEEDINDFMKELEIV